MGSEATNLCSVIWNADPPFKRGWIVIGFGK